MKKIFLVIAVLAITSSQNLFSQDTLSKQATQLLDSYYQLKDNLVKGNAKAAATTASELINAVNKIGKVNDIIKGNLLKEATTISQTEELKLQRERFAILSDNMIELAKTTKLSTDPVYQQYCPMKKASWLSNEKGIKNPYYGNAMLTCGTVKATF